MIDLHLLEYKKDLKFQVKEGKRFIFDTIRKKWLVALPEELVRQLLIQFLIQKGKYNPHRIAVERQLVVNSKPFRCDLLIFGQNMQALMLVECKAPQVKLSQAVFQQVATYNYPLQVPYLLITNGLESYCCQLDFTEQQYKFLTTVPLFEDLQDPLAK